MRQPTVVAVALALLLAVLLLAFGPGAKGADPALVVLDHALFVKSEQAHPGEINAGAWEERMLPDYWRRTRANSDGYGWYHTVFDLPAHPGEPWAMHVPYVSTAMALSINGVEVVREPAFDAPHVAARAGLPQLFTLPASLLRPGRNTMDVRLRVERDINAGLSRLELGPQHAVMPRFLALRFWRVDLPRAMNLASLVASVFMLLLWLRRPRETLHLWYFALAWVWALRSLYFTGDDRVFEPLRARLGTDDLVAAASLSLGFALLVVVVHRFAGHKPRLFEHALLAMCVALPLAVAPLGNQVLQALRPAWWGWCVAMAVAAAWSAGRMAGSHRHWNHGLVLLGVGVMLAMVLHGWLVDLTWLAFDPMPWLAYGPPLMLLAVVAAFGGRYFQAFDEAEQLNTQLERRVAEKSQALERHFERIAQLEMQAAVIEERDRLMRDMHDGVGSQLIGALHALERGQIEAPQAALLLRQCIDDLRLVIDSLDPEQQSVVSALANLRYRLEPRLAAAGIALAWDLDNAPVAYPPGTVLQLLRIVQEALSNALKHSGAQRISVRWSAQADGSAMTLAIRDDGKGFAVGDVHAGRGLSNMRFRAERVGARFELRSQPCATEIVVAMPTAPPA